MRPILVEDAKFNSHCTDLKPLFEGQLKEFPYIVIRNKNAINLIDLNNKYM